MKEIPSFFKKPDPITDIADTKEYDIVVIGAGSPGVPCALKAAELGAKVAILQKEVEKCVSMLEAASGHRAKRELLDMWAKKSGEAVLWTIEKGKEAGAQVVDMGTNAHAGLLKRTGWHIEFTTCVFGPKPYDTGAAMKAMCKLA